MSVDVREEQKHTGSDEAVEQETPPPRPPLLARFRMALAQIDWRQTLTIALLMGVGWCALFLSNSVLQILAGVVPVVAGMFLGRRVKQQLLLHGLILGVSGFLVGLVVVSIYAALSGAGVVPPYQARLEPESPPTAVGPEQLILIYLSFSVFALIPFPAFGAVIAGRSEQRNREMRQQIEERGGRLERPGAVRTLEDLRGLSLPQLGTYVSNLFKKKGFAFNDWHFIDKDKHLDLQMEYEGEPYLLRLSVADKVRPGTIESLAQDMRRRGTKKGLVITSTEFTPDAVKASKGRRNIVLVDGQTLFDIAEN